MIMKEIHSQIEVQMGERVPYGEFYSAFIRTIRLLNLSAEKPRIIQEIAGSGGYAYTIDDTDDDTVISDTTVTTLISGSRWLDGIEWDSLTNSILLPQKYLRVLKLWYDDELMDCVPYDILKSREIDDLCYANVNRHIYFAGDLDGETTSIKMKAELEYSIPAKTDIEYTGMPDAAEGMIINSILNILYSTPKYFNTTLFGIHRTAFNNALDQYNMMVMMKEPQSHEQPRYTY